MGRKPKLVISILVGIAVLIGLGILGYIYLLKPTISTVEPIPNSLNAFLVKPLIGSTGMVGEAVPVSAEAVSIFPIQSLELWVDGVLIDRTNAPTPDLKQLNGLWEWTPAEEGEQTLMARALDSKGQMVNSNIIRVKVNPASPAGRNILPNEGDTLALIAQNSGISLQDLVGVNPSVDPNAPLKAGQPISLPSPPGGSTSPLGEPPPDPDNPLPDPPPPPPPPGPENPPAVPFVTGSLDGCNAKLEVIPGDVSATGYRLYVISPGALGPELLATFGPLGSIDERHAFTHQSLFGTYKYYSEAFNANGTVHSQLISLDIKDDQCSVNAKKPANVKLITRYGFDKAYCFVTNVGTKTHIRMPLTQDTFISPMDKAELENWGQEWFPGLMFLQGRVLIWLHTCRHCILTIRQAPRCYLNAGGGVEITCTRWVSPRKLSLPPNCIRLWSSKAQNTRSSGCSAIHQPPQAVNPWFYPSLII
ncbi:MAG: LysM domain-containing protein [Anaerolineaceae bacterium]